jgi:hypothetical protein
LYLQYHSLTITASFFKKMGRLHLGQNDTR